MRAPPTADLQARLDAGIDALVAAINAGERPWVGLGAWRFSFPVHWRTGEPVRGLAALLLWRAAPNHGGAFGWRPAPELDDPRVVVVPGRGRRGEAPIALMRWPRAVPGPPPMPVFNVQHVDDIIADLSPQLPADPAQVRELALAFVSALRRADPGPLPAAPGPWTAEGLRRACAVALLVADAAYARQVGKLFIGPAVRDRPEVRALFPLELSTPAAEDKAPALRPGRALGLGAGVAQLPMQRTAHLRLDRVYDRGRVIFGAANIWARLTQLGLRPTGEVSIDARLLGAQLAAALAPLPVELPWPDPRPDEAQAWRALRRRVLQAAWFHHRGALRGADLAAMGRRFVWRRLVPRIVHWAAVPVVEAPDTTKRRLRRSLRRLSPPQRSFRLGFDGVAVGQVPLLSLLDAMGPQGSAPPVGIDVLLPLVEAAGPPVYLRRPLPKAGGGRRWLDVPAPALADAQRALMKALAPACPWDGAAVGFSPGRSPALHARVHEGATAALIIDLRDFFGSVRPKHLRWLFGGERLIQGGAPADRLRVLHSFFARGPTGARWLPQGAPSSPWLANLAAQPLDLRLRAWARDWGAARGVQLRYSRYADDLCLSVAGVVEVDVLSAFLTEAEAEVSAAVEARGWAVARHKTRRWRAADRAPLVLCGVEVPAQVGGPCRLPREARRRARAAQHHLRGGALPEAQVRGQLAWAFGATGALAWLPWTSVDFDTFAVALAGPVLAEALAAGVADGADGGGG